MNVGSTWVLTDKVLGHARASLSVATLVGNTAQEKPIFYNRLAHIPGATGPYFLFGLDQQKSASLTQPWPKLIIASGSQLGRVARTIKRQAAREGCVVRLLQINDPVYGREDFDLIITPAHDQISGANILSIIGTPTLYSQDELAASTKKWMPKLAHLKTPFVSLFIGGDVGRRKFSNEDARELGRLASTYASEMGASLLISNSRRTSAETYQTLLSAITIPFYAHHWSSQGDNPYFAFLNLSSAFIVTGDSISMCSDVCTLGKPLLIHAAPSITKDKFKTFHDQLYALKAALPLASASGSHIEAIETPDIVRNPLRVIADEMTRRGLLA